MSSPFILSQFFTAREHRAFFMCFFLNRDTMSHGKVLLLTEGDVLISFCTYAEQDDIREPSLTPWVGFVYTFPEHRGKRCMGKLLDQAYDLAKHDKHEHIYISTGETGLYEKYGYSFWKTMKDMHGEDSRVYRIDVERN